MKKACLMILAIALIISVGFNIYLFNQSESMETSLANITEQLESLKGTLQEKESTITDKDNQIAELEKTIAELEKTIADLQKQIEDGKLVDKEGTTIVNEETGEVTEAPTGGSGSEQSSTAGGAGQTKQPENNPVYAPSSEPNQMDPNEAFGKFGAEFIGSGREGSTGDALGNGGYGIVLQ